MDLSLFNQLIKSMNEVYMSCMDKSGLLVMASELETSVILSMAVDESYRPHAAIHPLPRVLIML